MGGTDSFAVKAKKTYASYREAAGIYHLAPMLLVVVVLLTHFTIGSAMITETISYADLMCFAGIAVSVAVIFAGKALPAFGTAEAAGKLITSVTAIAGLLFAIGQVTPPEIRVPMLIMSAIAEGAFIVIVGTYWFDYFSNEPMEVVLITLAICLIGGCAISWFLLGVSPSRYAVGNFILIVGAGFTLSRALAERHGAENAPAPASNGTQEHAKGPQSALSLLMTIFMLSMAAMFSLSVIGRHLWHGNDVWLVIAPTALVVLMAVLFFERAETGALLYIALLFAVAGVLMSTFLDVHPAILLIIATNGFTITISSSIAFMLHLAKDSKRAPHDVGTLLVAVTFTGCMAGRAAAEAAAADAGGSIATAAAIGITVILIACTLASTNSGPTKGLLRRRLRKERGDQEKQADGRRAIQELCEEKGLGAREAEALDLLLEGCSAKEVAERMFVADGTAKAHIRHVYRKLDVHDRDALFAVVAEYTSRRRD